MGNGNSFSTGFCIDRNKMKDACVLIQNCTKKSIVMCMKLRQRVDSLIRHSLRMHSMFVYLLLLLLLLFLLLLLLFVVVVVCLFVVVVVVVGFFL